MVTQYDIQAARFREQQEMYRKEQLRNKRLEGMMGVEEAKMRMRMPYILEAERAKLEKNYHGRDIRRGQRGSAAQGVETGAENEGFPTSFFNKIINKDGVQWGNIVGGIAGIVGGFMAGGFMGDAAGMSGGFGGMAITAVMTVLGMSAGASLLGNVLNPSPKPNQPVVTRSPEKGPSAAKNVSANAPQQNIEQNIAGAKKAADSVGFALKEKDVRPTNPDHQSLATNAPLPAETKGASLV